MRVHRFRWLVVLLHVVIVRGYVYNVGWLVCHRLMSVHWFIMNDRMRNLSVVLCLHLNRMALQFMLMSNLLLFGDLVNFDIDRFLLVISLFNPLVQVSKHLLRVFDIIVDCVWLCMWIE